MTRKSALDDKLVYVIDTNILIDYMDIIQDEGKKLIEPIIDLSDAHLVIPTTVIRELSKFKKEGTDRGKAARVILKKLRGLVADDGAVNMKNAYELKAPIEIPLAGGGCQSVSILPVHKNFHRSLPFHPSTDDMDGHIIMSAMAASLALQGEAVDGTLDPETLASLTFDNIVLLTNDNGLAIRARQRGVTAKRYGYKYPEPYTGRRDIVVAKEVFNEFYTSRRLERADFERMIPDAAKLVANEFIVMSLADENDYPKGFDLYNNPYFEHIGRYDYYEDAIVPLKYVKSFPVGLKNPGQVIYAEALMDPNISAIVCTGPAGSGKTYMSTIYGYEACRNGEYIGVTVVPCDSHSRIGALPGDLDEKMDPDVQPLKNALRNYFLNEDPTLRKKLDVLRKFGTRDKESKNNRDLPEKGSIKAKIEDKVELVWNNWYSSIPIDNARGRDFSYELAIYDEFQDQSTMQADTLIKRIGAEGKIVITGDIDQIHAPYLDHSNNGLVYASRQLFDNPMVAQVRFTEDEVVRHSLVKEVAKRQKADKEAKDE